MCPALTPYQQELLDGFREQVADCGTHLMFQGQDTALDALLVFPEESNDIEDAGTQYRASVGVTMARADFLAAGGTDLSRFTLEAEPSRLLHVRGLENDPGCSLVYFSAEEVP